MKYEVTYLGDDENQSASETYEVDANDLYSAVENFNDPPDYVGMYPNERYRVFNCATGATLEVKVVPTGQRPWILELEREVIL